MHYGKYPSIFSVPLLSELVLLLLLTADLLAAMYRLPRCEIDRAD